MLVFKEKSKKLILLIIFIIILSFVFGSKKQSTEIITTPAPQNQTNIGTRFDLDGIMQRFVWFKVDDLAKLRLIPNFDSQLATEELYRDYECKHLINGGFYSEENEPIGLFVVEGNTTSEKISNQTFDGFMLITENIAEIKRVANVEGVKYALQTGPVLFENGEIESLKLSRDQYARRMIAFIDAEGSLYFATVFNDSSYLQGPLLASTPQAVEKIEEIMQIDIVTAINLDGGAASAFYTPEFKLEESTSVGSFFCIK